MTHDQKPEWAHSLMMLLMGKVCNNDPSDWREKECITQNSMPLEKAVGFGKDKDECETNLVM